MIDTLTGTAGSTIDNSDTVSQIKSARVLCDTVYNVAHGQIVYIGVENGRAVVNVKCNPSEVLRYGNLKELNCQQSYFADIGAQLGIADRYVEFEYCTLWKGKSNYPVRINSWTYYKQDPTEILEGLYTVRRDGAQEQGFVLNRDRVRFTDEQKKIFGENVLDKMDEIRAKQKWSTAKSLNVLRQLGMPHRSKSEGHRGDVYLDYVKSKQLDEEDTEVIETDTEEEGS